MIMSGKKLIRTFFLFWIMFLTGVTCLSQSDSILLTEYTPDFEFEDGIYLIFDQVKNNAPIPKSRILTNVPYNDRDFFFKVLDNKKIFFYDEFGMKQEVRTNNIWGFSRNGVLYIGVEDNFYRITVLGQICHFVANVTTYNARYYDPYYRYNPYDYYYRYGGYPVTTTSSEMRQYLLNFQTGEILDYDVKSLEILLMRDPELHDEYAQLRKKKKKQMKFLYIRKFNERNPLYIPVKQF